MKKSKLWTRALTYREMIMARNTRIAALEAENKRLREQIVGWRNTLDTIVEHASHAFGDLRRRDELDEVPPPRWPPEVRNEVGTVTYHLAAMAMYIHRIREAIYHVCPEEGGEG